MAAPFDVQQLRLTGPGVVLLEGVRVKIGSESLFALSETGRLVIQLEAAEQHELVWVSRSGGVEPLDRTWTGNFSSPALSPDGTRLAVVLRDRGARSAHIWVKRLDDGARSRLTSTHGVNMAPAWTPDGRSLTFSVDSAADNQSWTLWTQRADGSAAGVSHGVPGSDARWSPDGKWLLYRRGFIAADVLGLRPDQDSLPTTVLASEHGERNAVISPDGRWIAYTSNETGRDEVYVKPFPDTDAAKWVVSTTGGIEPLWSRSGQELFYRNDQRQMVAVRVATDPTFSLGPASVLFTETAFLRSLFRPQYDVTPDDQRFIMVRHAEGDAVGRLILLENWQAELKRLAPR
jgi:eukaryotic-like serine/threonine-protein kinase